MSSCEFSLCVLLSFSWLGICILPSHFEMSRGQGERASRRKTRGKETLYKCFFWGPRCKFSDLPCSFFKLKLGKKNKVFYPHWMVCQRKEFLSRVRYFRLRIHIFCRAHLTDCLFKVWLKGMETLDAQWTLGQPEAVCIHRAVHWSRSSDSQHLRPCAVSYSFQARSFSVKPLQRGRNH